MLKIHFEFIPGKYQPWSRFVTTVINIRSDRARGASWSFSGRTQEKPTELFESNSRQTLWEKMPSLWKNSKALWEISRMTPQEKMESNLLPSRVSHLPPANACFSSSAAVELKSASQAAFDESSDHPHSQEEQASIQNKELQVSFDPALDLFQLFPDLFQPCSRFVQTVLKIFSDRAREMLQLFVFRSDWDLLRLCWDLIRSCQEFFRTCLDYYF